MLQLHMMIKEITKLVDANLEIMVEFGELLMKGCRYQSLNSTIIEINIGKVFRFFIRFLLSACRFEVDSPSSIFNGRSMSHIFEKSNVSAFEL